MWFEHIRNGQQAARSAFGEDIPELEGVVLDQIVLDGPGGFAVALNLCHPPRSVPARWRERGYDGLQLRLRFAGTDDLVIKQQPGADWTVSVIVEKGRLCIASADWTFELSSSFIDSRLEFFPYRSGEYELGRPPPWFRQL